MRRRRRFLALLFICFAFLTPLAFFYFTIANETNHDDYNSESRFRTFEATETVEMPKFTKLLESECAKFPENVTTLWPDCLEKMKWIRTGWKTHKCYSENRVDGSECSFRYYLSQVETYCPPIENLNKQWVFAKMSPSIRRLLPILEIVPPYMKTRITRLWQKWKNGAHEVFEKYEKAISERRKLNVLVFIGFLANEQKLKMAKTSDHGGPLGELLQWSDLLASLSIIGHHLEVSTDKTHMRSIVWKYGQKSPCQYVNGVRQHLDIIFTDIMGLNILRQQHRQFLNTNRCRIRLLDSFGTHAEFGNKAYFLQNKKELSGKLSQRNPWGGHGLDLRQHWTFYPHSDDNTFLGFVVDAEDNRKNYVRKQPTALVYGKEQYMWKDAEVPIRVLKKLVKVHATVADMSSSPENKSSIFENVQNHGFLNSDQISQLLDSTTIFFGLGFPLEGPAPLEAIAHGAVFINAKFREPKSRRNYRFLAEKPTLREVSA
uniref:alpha-1,6-mannosyl-glycoprotein 6-beta-N-acetylglucosaminyltransferase n=1 Tax=Caenorhabditis japonica TaxID=281687 RepID=A0A8R1DGG6_CAEJA